MRERYLIDPTLRPPRNAEVHCSATFSWPSAPTRGRSPSRCRRRARNRSDASTTRNSISSRWSWVARIARLAKLQAARGRGAAAPPTGSLRRGRPRVCSATASRCGRCAIESNVSPRRMPPSSSAARAAPARSSLYYLRAIRAALPAYEGSHRFPNGGIVAVHRTGDSAYSEIDGLGRVEMLFDAPDRFRVLELDATVRPSSAPMAR
jgi:hypothetical protein